MCAGSNPAGMNSQYKFQRQQFQFQHNFKQSTMQGSTIQQQFKSKTIQFKLSEVVLITFHHLAQYTAGSISYKLSTCLIKY